jgi:hypothetical protein
MEPLHSRRRGKRVLILDRAVALQGARGLIPVQPHPLPAPLAIVLHHADRPEMVGHRSFCGVGRQAGDVDGVRVRHVKGERVRVECHGGWMEVCVKVKEAFL